jgi:hypothetical protein
LYLNLVLETPIIFTGYEFIYIVIIEMQIDFLEKKFEQERKALKFQVLELEKKLEGVTKELAVVESTLTGRNSDLASLQNNLRELEELREMKEV